MSLVEMLVSLALTMALGGTIMSLVLAGQTIARTQPEAADLHQRARIALHVLAAELRDAGAGLERGGSLVGPLARYFPPIAPSIDGGITIWKTTNRNAQAGAAMFVGEGATTVALDDSNSCLPGESACGFASGMTAIAFTAAGCRTTLRVAAVSASALQLAAPLSGCSLEPGSAVAEGEVRTYRVDPVSRQLIRREEATGSSAPVLDGVTALTTAFFADGAAIDPIVDMTDPDLKRVRRVRLTLTFVASNPLLRIPDFSMVVDLAPRNNTDR